MVVNLILKIMLSKEFSIIKQYNIKFHHYIQSVLGPLIPQGQVQV